MIIATSNKANRLIFLSYIGHIQPQEITYQQGEIKAMLEELLPGFRLLADFSHFESMDLNCMVEMGKLMEMLDQTNMEMVVRVIPDPHHDPGMSILTVFHYKHRSKVITYNNFAEAAKAVMS